MIQAGFTTIDPVTMTRTIVIESDAETNGAGFTLEVTCPPMAPSHILEHLHLAWTETFEILSGRARYKLDGNTNIADAGDTIVMPANQPHVHPWNAGDKDMVYRQTTEFAQPSRAAVQDVLGAFATINGLARDGKIAKRGLPKNPLQFAATLRTLTTHGGFDAKAPIPVQRMIAATLGRIAQAVGYRGSYDKYLDPPSDHEVS